MQSGHELQLTWTVIQRTGAMRTSTYVNKCYVLEPRER